MSKKQETHLKKAREIKAQKHATIKTSKDALGLINDFIKNIDIERQAQSNNASNVLNALISYQKLLKENEGVNSTNEVDAIKVMFVNSSDPITKLRVALLERQTKEKLENIDTETYQEREIIALLRARVDAYERILRHYDANNTLITDTKEILETITEVRKEPLEYYDDKA